MARAYTDGAPVPTKMGTGTAVPVRVAPWLHVSGMFLTHSFFEVALNAYDNCLHTLCKVKLKLNGVSESRNGPLLVAHRRHNGTVACGAVNGVE